MTTETEYLKRQNDGTVIIVCGDGTEVEVGKGNPYAIETVTATPLRVDKMKQ